MMWNWQQPDWPDFSYGPSRIEESEKRLLLGAGLWFGAFKHLGEDDKRQLTVELISNEALKTSEIEGETLNRDSLQSSIRRQFGLMSDNRKVSPAEQGIAELMVSLYRGFAAPLSHAMLFEWHQMLANGRRDLHDIGHYRTHSGPMQIVSGAVYAPKVHFEAPPSSKMMPEMDRFIAWFNDTAPEGKNPLPALLRAGMAHLYFVSIHPFEDGNGRIGRALAEKALARMFREEPEGFTGELSAEKYIHITGATRATATRDLQDLVGKGALSRTGERKHTRYHLYLDAVV